MHTFETERLLMRQLCAGDKELYYSCYTDPTLMQHIGVPLSRNASLLSFNTALKIASTTPVRRHTWVMQEKSSGNAIGLLALFCDHAMPDPISAELGIIVLSRFQNKGYPNEAMSGLVHFAFQNSRLDVLLGRHKRQNGAASKIMRHLGFMLAADNLNEATYSQWTLNRSNWLERSTTAGSA